MGAVLQFIVKASFGAEKLFFFFLPSGDSQRSKGTSLLRLLLRLRLSLASCRPGKPFAIRCWDMMRQWNTCFLAIANGIYTSSTFFKHMMYNKYIKKHYCSTYININRSRLQYIGISTTIYPAACCSTAVLVSFAAVTSFTISLAVVVSRASS